MKWGVRRTKEELMYNRQSIEAHIRRHAKRIKTPNHVTINGIVDHALDRIENYEDRKVNAKEIIDALSNPLEISKERIDKDGRKSIQYIGMKGTVAVNPDTGFIVTVWKTGSKKAKKLMNKKE